jgi:formylglycine-generating enzyme required for sulfatase activity
VKIDQSKKFARPQFARQSPLLPMTLSAQRYRLRAAYFSESLDHHRSRDHHPGVSLDMVYIPGGQFVMGSSENEEGHTPAESPQHPVTIAAFLMGKTLVTQAQWQAVTDMPLVNQALHPRPSTFKGDHRPIEQVSWHDAVEFCDRLSRYTNRLYRLPSEAEWEYACRAGSTTPFHFGQTISTTTANYDGDYIYGNGEPGEYRSQTTVVESFHLANRFGLFDMHGNVWEWCLDHWHENYQSAPVDGSAWIEPDREKNAERVLRGGSWYDTPKSCRSAFRGRNDAGYQDSYFGFRVVCAIPATNKWEQLI